VSRDQGLRH